MQPEILYKSIRHGYVRITREGNLQLTIPKRLKNDDAFKQVLLDKGQSLLQRHAKKYHLQTQGEDFVMLFGEQVPLGAVAPSAKKLPQALKTILHEYATPILDDYSQKLGIPYKILKIRKTISKRGSCMSDQTISLNLDLVHTPTRLVKYVIIHEACHLKIKNHSRKFREIVEKYCPNHKLLRKELKNLVIK